MSVLSPQMRALLARASERGRNQAFYADLLRIRALDAQQLKDRTVPFGGHAPPSPVVTYDPNCWRMYDQQDLAAMRKGDSFRHEREAMHAAADAIQRWLLVAQLMGEWS